jgi:uncharacterized membrane protein YphA (DoxX/SURF4 family)
MTIDPVIAWSLRLGLALLFAAAAWHKVTDRRRFKATVSAYEVLPTRTSSMLSWGVPLAEGAVAIGLVYPPTVRAAAVAACSMLLLYTGAIAINLARGRREIDCGCFASRAVTPLNGALIARNAGLIAATCALLLPIRMRPLVWVDGLTLLTALTTLILLWATAQRLLQTGPALRGHGGIR